MNTSRALPVKVYWNVFEKSYFDASAFIINLDQAWSFHHCTKIFGITIPCLCKNITSKHTQAAKMDKGKYQSNDKISN